MHGADVARGIHSICFCTGTGSQIRWGVLRSYKEGTLVPVQTLLAEPHQGLAFTLSSPYPRVPSRTVSAYALLFRDPGRL